MSRYLIIGTTFVVPNKDVLWLKKCINDKFKEMINYGFLNNEQVALEFVVKENIKKFDNWLENGADSTTHNSSRAFGDFSAVCGPIELIIGSPTTETPVCRSRRLRALESQDRNFPCGA